MARAANAPVNNRCQSGARRGEDRELESQDGGVNSSDCMQNETGECEFGRCVMREFIWQRRTGCS